MEQKFDIIVVGGGHAGCEAALIGSKLGLSVGLVTMRRDRLAEMSCNPSIGGVGKGQLVKELDALGGVMGRNADHTGIQFKRLNTRKGSAVQSSRCQSDKIAYAKRMTGIIGSANGIHILECEAKGLLIYRNRIIGLNVRTNTGVVELSAEAVVITTGTFMRSLMHCGSAQNEGGRFGEPSSNGLSDSLSSNGVQLLRLKTGTPARLKRESIDFSKLQIQPGDTPPRRFSFFESRIELAQVPCYLGYTTNDTHEVIRNNLARSPLYSGQITGIGPRYCPSIEDKVVKFPDKVTHHIFFEPESLQTDWIYPNGLSTSLPADVQYEFIKTISGCESVEMVRPGYAVEYDCINPSQLDRTLQLKAIQGLFLAGQVNGTSGYEEAAAQGLIAGINAANSVIGRSPLVLERNQSYIGVMVDDLITKGITEPYRMFTSRAEYRLSIREDNADIRLTPIAIDLGTIKGEDQALFERRQLERQWVRAFLSHHWIKPEQASDHSKNNELSGVSIPVLSRDLLKRPEYALSDIECILKTEFVSDPVVRETVEIETKYEGYINIQKEEISRIRKMAKFVLPEGLDYSKIAGISIEVREKLSKARPESLKIASQISGITPAALTAIISHLSNRKHQLSNESF